MSKDRVAMKARDGSTVWIPRDKVADWQKAQEDNSPEKQQRVNAMADRLYKRMMERVEAAKKQP